MNNLKELEKKYEELGKEIERLKKEQETVVFKGDPIFLLSKEEYEKYKDKIPKINCWWWLRSPGDYSNYTVFVRGGEGVDDYGDDVLNDILGVRPALKISSLKIGKELCPHKPPVFFDKYLVFNGTTWVKIDNDLYISELPIDFRRFDKESNIYETSEVRKFLLNWFEERQELN